MALLSDAGHNLSDVASLAISMFAFKIAKKKATNRYTYGFHNSTILASLTNAVILLIAVGSIGREAIQRFLTPEATQGSTISIVAAIGIVINSISAYLFFKGKEKDLNVKCAYLHLLTDALVSLGVVLAGILISLTNYYWIDPFISLLIMIVVISSTWNLLTESLRLSIDGVPKKVNIHEIKELISNYSEIKSIHHVHIWAISTSHNAMTAHLVLEEDLSEEKVLPQNNK